MNGIPLSKYVLYVSMCRASTPGNSPSQSFLEQLKDHLLTRIRGEMRAGEGVHFSNAEHNHLYFQHDCIYKHAVLHVNYTTYDVQRQQDYINPRTSKRFVMVHSNEDPISNQVRHPFWYAQVLGIFHTQVQINENGCLSAPIRMEFLWVRWLGLEPGYNHASPRKWLDRVGFVPHDDADAFGFLDPSCVLRGCHLIPAFNQGRTTELCPPLIARDDEGDWDCFYVNRWASTNE